MSTIVAFGWGVATCSLSRQDCRQDEAQTASGGAELHSNCETTTIQAGGFSVFKF
jgi:hypothetical protein